MTKAQDEERRKALETIAAMLPLAEGGSITQTQTSMTFNIRVPDRQADIIISVNYRTDNETDTYPAE